LIDHELLLCYADSLANNALCGVKWGEGTYTAEGITKLCEGLKGSAVTSLKCAAAPRVFALVSAPAETLHASSLAVSMVTRFRLTSSRARSRLRRLTSHASGSASRPPSSSRAASRTMACSRSSSAPPAPRAFAFVSAPADRKANTFCAHRLDRNYLGPKGGAALAKGLKGNSTLQSLS
jgi:hypothetical protein